MGRSGFFKRRKFFREALILLALLLILFPPSSLGNSVTRMTAGVLFVAAGFFFFLGASEFLKGLSLSRRLVLCFFSVVLLWGLSGISDNRQQIPVIQESSDRASKIKDLGERIDSVAEAGSSHVRNFVDSAFTDETGNFINTLGEVTGVATGVLIDAFLTSTSVDTSAGPDTLFSEGNRTPAPVEMIPLLRLAILAVSIILLAALRGFIYIDRTPLTVTLYRITTGMVFVVSLLHVIGFNVLITSSSDLFQGIEVQLSSFILLTLSVMLGFCQRWIQYLSRRSRYLLLFATLVSVVMIRDIYYQLEGSSYPVTGGLDAAVVMVIAPYILFAFITMLLQLPTARILEKRGRELSTLQDLSQALHSSFELDQLCTAAVRLGVKLTGAEACWFHLNSGSSHIHSKPGDWSGCLKKLDSRWYKGVGQRIDATGHGFMINNYRRSTLRRLEINSEGYSRIASLVAAPVEVRGERLGVIIAASSKQFFFLDYTRGLFDSFTRQIAQAIQSARLFGEKLQRQSLERELELARNIQRDLLPGSVEVPDGWELEAVSIPCRVMGGDYYDVIHLSEGRMAVAVADVSGKGAAAAMLMAALQASLRTLLRENLSLERTVSKLNLSLCDRMPDATFITFFLAVVDTKNGRMQYCCAGHDPPLLYSDSREGYFCSLDCGGLILGVLPEAEYLMDEVDFPEGARLLLYTDGVTETMSPEEEPFGAERLGKFLEKHSSESPETVISKLTELLEKFRGSGDQLDDVTALVLMRNGLKGRECPKIDQ